MKAVDAKVCPSCGARNKPSWEFCVGCGESLSDVTIVSADARAAAPAADVSEPAPEAASQGGPSVLSILALPVAIVIGIIILKTVRLPANDPPPNLFGAPAPTRAAFPLMEPGASALSEAEMNKGLSALQGGDVEKALALLEAEAARTPNDPRTRHAYATALWAANQKDRALREYETAASLEPEGGQKYATDYARALAGAGRLKDAADQYERLLRVRPDAVGLLNEAGRVYVELGTPEKAVPFLRRAAEQQPREALRIELASALERAGAQAEAEKVYRQMLADTTVRSEDPRLQLAELLYRSQRVGDAIHAIEEGLTRTPNSPALRKELASLLERAGRIPEAAREYREYARIAPQARDARELADRAARLENSSS